MHAFAIFIVYYWVLIGVLMTKQQKKIKSFYFYCLISLTI